MSTVFQTYCLEPREDPDSLPDGFPELQSSVHLTLCGGVSIGIHFDMARHPDRRCVVTAHSSTVGPMRRGLEQVIDQSPDLMAHWRSWTINRSAWMYNGPSPQETTVEAQVSVLLDVRPPDQVAEAVLLKQIAQMEVVLLCSKIEHALRAT